MGSRGKASEFYTGLVAEMYDALVSYRAPVAFYADLIRRSGEPALEIGCGTGHPLLDLVWYSRDEFRRLLRNARFQTDVLLGENGKPVADDAPAFIFIARRPSGSARSLAADHRQRWAGGP